MPSLHLTGVGKRFAGHTALHDLTLTVQDGEIFTLLGPSGCGKSTTLWSIAGLHRPDSGTISFGDRVVYDHGRVDVEPEHRNCGVVFQSYAIWPHMSVRDNVAYPLKIRKVDRRERARRVEEVLDLVELGRHASRYPHELSGGQQQRVALARALAHPPDMLLLDEPFSNLDAKLRDRSRQWLKTLQEQVGVTTVFVTHDQDEALSVSDRILVMDQGRVRQIGTPAEVYEEPADLFVAGFVGTANILPATVVEADGTCAVVRLDGVAGPDGVLKVPHRSRELGPVSICVRPENVEIRRAEAADGTEPGAITVPVESSSYLGDHYRYGVTVGGSPLTVSTTRRVGTGTLTVRFPPEDVRIYHPEPRPEETTHALVH
ncbi:ABC transporter ATP-binding protein [Streptomyces sp. NBC_01476]|uniref:ABC transporter ATP-binding protein n=1 Tax=Streptomyces sp. NBC_01476 TaxID=2903881 RepID=UPI002E33AE63|nr:ABC transporter ATP-binding protein [Streptomyces sp. NBC_01476]